MPSAASSPANAPDSAALVQALSERNAQLKASSPGSGNSCLAANRRSGSSTTRRSPFSKAIAYMQRREYALRMFLEDPAVPMDNNHTVRALRVVPMGRKNRMFRWTELGAEHVGIIQSLVVTCKPQGIDLATYLVDVLQRVAIHPASKVEELTPRVWKDLFADNPLRSDLTHEH